jgi:inverse autotransporter-like protein with beta domain
MPGKLTQGPSSPHGVTLAAIVSAVFTLSLPYPVADGQQTTSTLWSDSPNKFARSNDDPASHTAGYSGDSRAFSRLAEQTVQSTVESDIKSLLPSSDTKNSKYDWLRRTEFDAGFLQRGKPQQSILTVQPLFRSLDKSDTIFVQGSVYHYAMFGEYRWTANLGAGYRHLLADNRVLLGLNGFYDREFTNLHQRMSVGGEAKWGPLDWNINRYEPLSGDRAVNGDTEKALGGWDTELGTQIPFLPWASVYARYFRWEADVATSDTTGPEYSTEMRLAPGVSLKLSHSSYDFSNYTSRGQNTVLLQFQLAGGNNKPTLLSGPVVSRTIFADRDLSEHALDKVRRENRIIVERRTTIAGATVIISRLN